MTTKMMSARASLRAALQSPATTKFMAANDPDSDKFGKKKMPKQTGKASLGIALQGRF